jgi:PleD family two-component response regulator
MEERKWSCGYLPLPPTQPIGEISGCDESLPEKRRLDSGEVTNPNTSPIRILSVDDHPIVRQGITGLLSIQPDMILVGEASDGREALQLFRMHRPDITLIDLQMP